MRNPAQVARQICDVVPDQYRAMFDWLAKYFLYRAPEQYDECFRQLAKHCNEIVLEAGLDEDWKVKMISILTMKSEKELREEENERDRKS